MIKRRVKNIIDKGILQKGALRKGASRKPVAPKSAVRKSIVRKSTLLKSASRKDALQKDSLQKRALVASCIACCILFSFALSSCSQSTTDVQKQSGNQNSEGENYTLVNDGVLTVASTLSTKPYESESADEPQGFTVDLMKAIAREMDLECQYLSASSTTDKALARTSADESAPEGQRADVCASSLNTSTQLPEGLEFTDSYLDLNIGVVALKDSSTHNTTSSTNFSNLENLTIAVEEGSAAETWLRENVPSAQVSIFASTTEAFTALEAKSVDAVATSFTEAKWRTKVAYANAQVIAAVTNSEQFSFAVKSENHELGQAINSALQTLRENGTYDELYDSWFGDASQRGEVEDARTPEQGAPTYAKR